MGSRRPEAQAVLAQGSRPAECSCSPPFRRRSAAMAKSKNHTAHNQNRKAHRNGIKKTRRPRKGQMSTRGMNQKFVRNQKYARNGMLKGDGDKEARKEAQKEAQKIAEERKAKAEQEREEAMLKAAKSKK